jgi:hypothetical protein
MDNNSKSKRSFSEQVYSAYFRYMGIPNMENITESQIEEIQDEGELTWYERTFNADRKMLEKYSAKKAAWFEGDRFILEPLLYEKKIKFYLTGDLPKLLATYVRGQFTGSSEKITAARIKEVCTMMLEENPTWWHSSNRKHIFLERFKIAYPRCCDGTKPSRSSTHLPVQIRDDAGAIATKKPNQCLKKSRKQKELDIRSLIGLLIVAIILWFIFVR